MIKSGYSGTARVCPLNGLRKLHLVTDEDNVLRRYAHGDDIGETHLSGFIDKEIIELSIEVGTREEPRSSGDELMIALGRRCAIIVGVGDHRSLKILIFFA